MESKFETTKQSARRFGRRAGQIGLLVLVLALAGFYLWRTYSYSNGTRDGLMYKISKKGYIFKTFEGELHQGGSVMITEQSVWKFSVKNEDLYLQIQQMGGKNVRLYYNQLNNAFPWQGDTDYIVFKAELIQ